MADVGMKFNPLNQICPQTKCHVVILITTIHPNGFLSSTVVSDGNKNSPLLFIVAVSRAGLPIESKYVTQYFGCHSNFITSAVATQTR